MDLVLWVHRAFIQVKYGLLSSQCCILQLCHPRCLFFFFFFTLGFHLHGPDHTHGSSSLECKPTLVLLGKSVPQLSCSVSMSFLYPYLFYFPHSNHLDLASSYFDEDRTGLEVEVTDEEIKRGSSH